MSKLNRAFNMAKSLVVGPEVAVLGSDKVFMGTWLTKQEYQKIVDNLDDRAILINNENSIIIDGYNHTRSEAIEHATAILVATREMRLQNSV